MTDHPSLDHLGQNEILEHSSWEVITTKVYSSSPNGKKQQQNFCSICKLFSGVHVQAKKNSKAGGHDHGFLRNSGLSPYGLNSRHI